MTDERKKLLEVVRYEFDELLDELYQSGADEFPRAAEIVFKKDVVGVVRNTLEGTQEGTQEAIELGDDIIAYLSKTEKPLDFLYNEWKNGEFEMACNGWVDMPFFMDRGQIRDAIVCFVRQCEKIEADKHAKPSKSPMLEKTGSSKKKIGVASRHKPEHSKKPDNIR